MKGLVGRSAALHIAFWQYDPWYRYAWFVWPQAAAILLSCWLLTDPLSLPTGKWAKPAACSPSNPGCAATNRVTFGWVDEVSNPTVANQSNVTVDRSAFKSSAAADQPKLLAALGAYARGDWAKALDTLKTANASDPNVQFVSALALLVPNATDQVREAQSRLRAAAAAGQRQAAGVLGRTLMIGAGGVPRDETEGRKLIEDGAAAGDTYAMRLASAIYLSRENYDPVKAVELARKAADAGDAIAAAQLAYFITTGRGGLVRDDSKAISYLRRSAELGYVEGQFTLGRYLVNRYLNHETEDMSEGVKWYERAYQRGYSFFALTNLARAHWFARTPPWADTKRTFELLQLCAPYAHGYCHYWLGLSHQAGAGTPRDNIKAYAYFTVARQLHVQEAGAELHKLDNYLPQSSRTEAAQLAEKISASLKRMPPVIALESAEAEAAGPSPWVVPLSQPALSASSGQPSSADWDSCKSNDLERAIAACARLISSGITGTQLGLAHFYQGWHFLEKKQYPQALAEDNKAIELGGSPAPAHNNRGVVFRILGNLDAAIRDYDEAIRVNPSYALAYENRALAHLLRNQPDLAIADANAAIRLNASSPRALWLRAGGYEAKAQWNEVISDCTAALGMNAKYSDCLDRRGGAYESLQNFEAAAGDYKNAAALGHADAMNHLGQLYLQGKGVAQDYAEARQWLEKSAQAGNTSAMNNLGSLYETGQGVAQDYAEARRWYEQSAKKENAQGMSNLGSLYRNGQGVPKDPAEAKQWFEKAAALGNAQAMTRLGMMYQNAEGMPANFAEARRWFEKAAALGDSWAMFNMGMMYELGEGVSESKTEAISWYQKAAARGHAEASRKLQILQ